MMLIPGMMTRLPPIAIDWDGKKYKLSLTPFGCSTIESNTGCGVFDLLNRLLRGDAFANDARAVMHQALTDSGHMDAQSIMDKHFSGKPLAANVKVAAAVLGAAVHGLSERDNG